VAALFDLLEKGRHETASLSDEKAEKRIERHVMDDANSSASVIG